MHFPVIDWLRFLPALVLLLTPIGIFHGAKFRLRPVSRGWDHRHWAQVSTVSFHVVDLARAALGSWLLIRSLTAAPGAHGLAVQAPMILQGAVRVLAVLLQTVICKEPDSANA